MDLMQIIEQMSAEEKEALLNTQFPAELEKEAEAELAQHDLAETLYAYGAVMADIEVQSADENLSKEASAELTEAHDEIVLALEESLLTSGLLENDDTVGLHKEAQAAAGILLQGYSDQLEKMAKAGMGQKVMKVLRAKSKQMKEMASKAGKHIKKNKGKYGAGAGAALLGAGAYGYKKHMDKKASELSVEELNEALQEEASFEATVSEGLDKVAAKGKGMVDKMTAALKAGSKKVQEAAGKAGKHVMKHKGKYLAGAGAAGALGGAAYLASKKKD